MGFAYVSNRLHCDGVDLQRLADSFGTPAYIYSEHMLTRNAEIMKQVFIDRGIHVSYAMKANGNPAILKLFKAYGIGVDIVSAGELQLAEQVGLHGTNVNFAGVGKTIDELEMGVEADIGYFNVESGFELDRLEALAEKSGHKVAVLLRLNPDIDPQTHPHISTGLKQNKFGMSSAAVKHYLSRATDYPHLRFEGIHCHIGSQIIHPQPYFDLIDFLEEFTTSLKEEGIEIHHVDLGGGFGVDHRNPFEDILNTTPFLESFADRALRQLGSYALHIQPGRALVANTGVLLSRVLGVKQNGSHSFVIIDGATTELIRPALYDAYHKVFAYEKGGKSMTADIVGPVCESSDVLAKQREIPSVTGGDLLIMASAGAYASSMSSTYNMRPLAPEIMIHANSEISLIRRRQSYDELTSLYS